MDEQGQQVQLELCLQHDEPDFKLRKGHIIKVRSDLPSSIIQVGLHILDNESGDTEAMATVIVRKISYSRPENTIVLDVEPASLNDLKLILNELAAHENDDPFEDFEVSGRSDDTYLYFWRKK